MNELFANCLTTIKKEKSRVEGRADGCLPCVCQLPTARLMLESGVALRTTSSPGRALFSEAGAASAPGLEMSSHSPNICMCVTWAPVRDRNAVMVRRPHQNQHLGQRGHLPLHFMCSSAPSTTSGKLLFSTAAPPPWGEPREGPLNRTCATGASGLR